MFKTPDHVHFQLIEAWKNGAEIQFFDEYTQKWRDIGRPCWDSYIKYRIKPDNNCEKTEMVKN